jgi:hypothetical protein
LARADSWNFLYWGLAHGAALSVVHLWRVHRPSGPRLPAPLAHAATLLFVMLGWTLFRSPDLATAGAMLGGQFGLHGAGLGAALSNMLRAPVMLAYLLGIVWVVAPALVKRPWPTSHAPHSPWWPRCCPSAASCCRWRWWRAAARCPFFTSSSDDGAPHITSAPRARSRLRWASTAVLLAAIGTAFVATWPNMGALRTHASAALLHDADARRALTKALVTTSFTEALARWQRQANWLLLRDLGPEVKRGEGNWLFFDEELQLHRDRTAHAAARATAVADIARALAGRHIALLVVVVPDKSRIESTHLGTLRRAPALDARVRDWTAKLDASGVATLDLAPVLSGSPASSFLHTDTHWNERGSCARGARGRPAVAADACAPGRPGAFGRRVEARPTGVGRPAAPGRHRRPAPVAATRARHRHAIGRGNAQRKHRPVRRHCRAVDGIDRHLVLAAQQFPAVPAARKPRAGGRLCDGRRRFFGRGAPLLCWRGVCENAAAHHRVGSARARHRGAHRRGGSAVAAPADHTVGTTLNPAAQRM